ncbi:uncharacterized protein EAF01_008082 [Botrytis porri]|uniref:uncharacterized protein n=1 Tax=Botrytis porri TaxID=87229 RepID=UPI0018FFAEC3|nr:uncharacterized protein EAF01_008082 [Botrytis porri]KAF7898869.1 hypothetical protein EAF01_008082 [Botrytis porri]
MSDPFSAASGAVGIISLGIQVSQGLVKYCSQVKNFTSEIATFKVKAESIHGILQNLESVVRKTKKEQKMIPRSVVLTLHSCQETLEKLNEGIGRHGKDRLSNRLTYCFMRNDLAAACHMLDSLQHNLSNALQVWILEDSTRHQADITQMITDQTVTHFHTSRKLEGCFEDLSKKIDIIISNKQQPLLESPSLLAQRCLELNAAKAESSLLLLKYKHTFRLRSPRPGPCQCPASPSCYTCPTCKGWQTIRKKYNVCKKLLGYSIAFTMFLTGGAGGFSIGPLLGFSATAPTSSPAFRLLYATKYMHPNRHPFQRSLDGKRWVYPENDTLRMHPEFDSSGGSHWDSSSHAVKYDESDKALEQIEELVN